MAALTRPDAEQESNCRKKWMENLINDEVEASARKSHARFRIFKSHPRQTEIFF